MSTEPNCAPCANCPPAPAPVMPRCNDIILPDGTYTNATVVVENGCITLVQQGSAPLYTPDICCPAGTGTGGGGDGLDGPPGPPGQNATIAIGTVTSLPFGSDPVVINVGTPTNAILDWGIPRGEDGADGDGAVSGVTDTSAGIVIEDGLVKALPVEWPPLLYPDTTGTNLPAGVTFTVTKDPATGRLLLVLDMVAYNTALVDGFNAALAVRDGQIDTINGQMSALQTQLISLQEQLAICCPAAEMDLDGDGTPDPGGTPGVSPPPPVDPN